MELTHSNNGFFSAIKSFIRGLSSVDIVEFIVPSDIFYRTELMCSCISEELELDFRVEHFIMAIYLNFIEDAITKYNPKKVLKMFSNRKTDNDTIDIVINGETEVFQRKDRHNITITVEMRKEDIKKGELIMLELRELYGFNTSFSRLLSAIWVDFIEEYKKGNNKRAYTAILNLLK